MRRRTHGLFLYRVLLWTGAYVLAVGDQLCDKRVSKQRVRARAQRVRRAAVEEVSVALMRGVGGLLIILHIALVARCACGVLAVRMFWQL